MNCRFHNSNQLQNFCSNQDCSLPLCPKCIHPHLLTPGSHHIASLPGFVQGTVECLKICISGLEQQIISLDNELSPQRLCSSYLEIIQKSQRQNIQQINRYYKNLEQQLIQQIDKLHSQHLQNMRKPLQDKLRLLNQHLRDLNNQQTVISTVIQINSKDQITAVQQLFNTIKERKNILKLSLPIIDFNPSGKAELKSNLKPQQLGHRGFWKAHGMHTSKIGQLEQQLLSIRTRWI